MTDPCVISIAWFAFCRNESIASAGWMSATCRALDPFWDSYGFSADFPAVSHALCGLHVVCPPDV